jgi:hypothetical protein
MNELHFPSEWDEIEQAEERQKAWSIRLADKTRQTVRNTFAKLQYLKSRYRTDISTFTDICLNMTPVKVLASLREFKNLVKLLARDTAAWMRIPKNEQALIVSAAKLAGIMILVPAWVLLAAA